MRRYPSKVMLFGEYTVIQGAPVLAIPYPAFSARWEQRGPSSPQQPLIDFLRFLQQRADYADQPALELDRLAEDLSQGLVFDSNIPIGYGLGSSGALVAAVYDRYGPREAAALTLLREQLGAMEHFFHGNSSGTDPLVCYLARPLLLGEEKQLEVIDLPDRGKDDLLHFFLIDTGTPRRTGPLVERYLQKCQEAFFLRRIYGELIPAVEDAITLLLRGERDYPLLEAMHLISHYQFRYLTEMVPASLSKHWLTGLESDWFKIKLCGAGGGGFLLGVTTAVERAQEQLADQALHWLDV